MPNIFCQQNMLEIGGICNMPQYWLAPKFEKIKHSLHLTSSHVENPFSASPICKKINDALILLLACIYNIVTSCVRRSAKPLYLVTSAVVFTYYLLLIWDMPVVLLYTFCVLIVHILCVLCIFCHYCCCIYLLLSYILYMPVLLCTYSVLFVYLATSAVVYIYYFPIFYGLLPHNSLSILASH